MNYWLDLFTGTTWDEFRKAGARVTGFRATMQNALNTVQPGDVFLCYLTGVKHWVGALKVVGPSDDQSPIWKDADFPVRFEVEPFVLLDPEVGVPMDALEGKVDFFAEPGHRGGYKGFLRRSPNRFAKVEDGQLILKLLEEAQSTPVVKDVDPKLLAKTPYFYTAQRKKGKATVEAVVSVPEPDEPKVTVQVAAEGDGDSAVSTTRHTEIQYHLLRLGADMGLDVWVAKNDRSRVWKGKQLGQMPRMVSSLPTQFNEATHRTIELIDVLWLKGASIIAAFEVECTTAVYSGLLRMSDLLALQPNLDIKLYLVAPDERRGKVEQEILRPTFTLRERPLSVMCGFLPFSGLVEKVEGIQRLGLASSLKPDFLEKAAEYFGSPRYEP